MKFLGTEAGTRLRTTSVLTHKKSRTRGKGGEPVPEPAQAGGRTSGPRSIRTPSARDGSQHKTSEYYSLGINIGSVLVPDQHHVPQVAT